ncbi:hypothetical protein Sjap_002448 [Stephania japonica]|uniref:Uncharacterized protein n=1 Tax=Stephania japonica TaxID=461633 RepID=A0AAP0KNH5_9MAGN
MKEKEEDQVFLNLKKNLEEIATFINSKQEVVVESKENQVEELLPSEEACHEAYKEVEKPNQDDCNVVNALGLDDSLDRIRNERHIEDIKPHDKVLI